MYDTDPNSASNEAITTVAHNASYELLYSYTKNRIYLSIKGFWKSPESVPNYLQDIEKALKLSTPGFTLLTDLRTMLTHPPRLNMMHIQAQNLIQAARLGKAVRVIPSDRIATLQVEEISNKSLMPSKNFTSLQEAENWLNA